MTKLQMRKKLVIEIWSLVIFLVVRPGPLLTVEVLTQFHYYRGGLGTVEAVVLLEQTGAHLAPVPFLQQVLALSVLADSEGSDDLISGERIATVPEPEIIPRLLQAIEDL